MAAYATYDNYTSDYMGSIITAVDFEPLATKASRWIDYYTRNLAAGYVADHPDDEAVMLCTCALAEVYQQMADVQASVQAAAAAASSGGTSGLASQSVGSYSVSYRSGGAEAKDGVSAMEALRGSLVAVAAQYLANTGLLYRGGRRGCGGCD